jgi:ectoine hydroxylase-related dioxygenase (phytanoyl-CoA dioxygenase family)
LVLLHDFTLENGATAVLPGSQVAVSWPDEETFWKGHKRITGKAGDVVLFSGALWHCAMSNNSQGVRTSLLGLHIPRFVRPMEDLVSGLKPDVLQKVKANPLLRRLVGVGIPFPSDYEKLFGHKTDHFDPDDEQVGFGIHELAKGTD